MTPHPKVPDGAPKVAYILSTWPRLSETFILNEVIGLERRGVDLRIFSVHEPVGGLVHEKVAEVRAPARCLAPARSWRKAFFPLLHLLRSHPDRVFRAALLALRYRRLHMRARFWQAVCLANLLEQEPVSHLHAHFAHAPTHVAMLTHLLTGIPYSFTAHAKDIYVKTPPDLLRAESARARAVVTCTDYNREFLVRQLNSTGNGKVRRIYHGLDLAQFPFVVTHPNGTGPAPILSVARLVPKKGLSDLIAAADLLRQRGRNFKLEIIGEGPLRQALEAQVARLGLSSQVRLLGPQPQEVVRKAYRRSLIFALPCVVAADGDRDGIPNVLMEAMACGVPVISTPVSGILELVETGREGLLVPPGDPKKLAEALDTVLSSPALRERLARAARVKVETHFSLEASVMKLLPLFQNGRVHENTVPVYRSRH